MAKTTGILFALLFVSCAVRAENVFTATVDCQVSCRSSAHAEPPVKLSSASTFDPVGWGLKRGNGNLWGMLAVQLWNWGGWVCEKNAESACGARDRIENFSLLGLRSGNWRMTEAPRCPRPGETAAPWVKSPYDPSIKLVHLSEKSFDAGVRPSLLPGGHLLGKGEKCETPLSADLCAGDCAGSEGDTESCETLCTAMPLARSHETVCADAFIAKMIATTPSGESAAGLSLACESYFYDSLKREADGSWHGYSGCAAYRGRPDCDGVVKRIQKRAPTVNAPTAPGVEPHSH